MEYNDNGASVFVDGGYPVYETQNLVSSGDDVSYVCYAVVKTPTVPYGDSLQVVVQVSVLSCDNPALASHASYVHLRSRCYHHVAGPLGE